MTTLRLGSRTFHWTFVVAEVKLPILGADFLAEYNLLVDLRQRRLVDAATYESINADFAPPDVMRVFNVRPRPATEFDRVINEFPPILTPTYSSAPPRHGVEYYIPTRGPPVFAKTRRLLPKKLAAVKKDFAEMEKLGIVRRSSSP